MINRCRLILYCLILSGNYFPASAQKNFDASAGLGYYELFHIGVDWNYSAKSSVGLYAGTNFNYQAAQCRSIGLVYSHIYIKPLIWKIQPGFSLKTQYWNQDDDNYYYNNISFLFQAVLSYPINHRLRLGIEGGGVINYTLETERKQNTTVGYPARWNGNGAFFFRYRITKNN